VVPPSLPLHVYEDGSAWLGITPFVVGGLRLRGTPPLPWVSRFLAERYCAFTVGDDGLPLRIEIHHPPWPLQPSEGDVEAQGMADQIGVELAGQPLLHFSARQDTVIWPLKPA
jgi:uncharacterized protein YqjF (DUF2071 family)